MPHSSGDEFQWVSHQASRKYELLLAIEINFNIRERQEDFRKMAMTTYLFRGPQFGIIWMQGHLSRVEVFEVKKWYYVSEINLLNLIYITSEVLQEEVINK